jgi:hypothetical protein
MSPHVPGLEFLVGEGLADGFQVFVGLLKTSAYVVGGSENRDDVTPTVTSVSCSLRNF